MSETGDIPSDLKYSQEHEWVRVLGEEMEVGITAYAANALGDVVFVELPKIGTVLMVGKPFGTVESVKSVSDLFAPLSGQVTAVNTALSTSPELVNGDPYGGGWMIRLKPTAANEVNLLLGATDYRVLLDGSVH